MSLKDIFNSIINYDLMNIIHTIGAIIFMVLPVGLVWFGFAILKDVLIDKQPHDRDIFAKIFMIISGIACVFVLPAFLIYYTYFN